MPPTNAASHSAEFSIPNEHPSLPGHFPGNTLVPGVVILDRVIDATEEWLGRQLHVRAVPQAKFLAPLRPCETATIALELRSSATMVVFTVRRGPTVIATGTLRLLTQQGLHA